MRKTIAQNTTDEMISNGYQLAGRTSGTYTFRKGSNLARELERLHLTKDDVVVKRGARAGKYRNDGYELLIYVKA